MHHDDDERYDVHAAASVQDGTSRVLKNDETFAVLDRQANIPSLATSHGIYHRGTRFLSELWLTLNGRPPLLLGSTVSPSNTELDVDLSNPALMDGDRCLAHAGELHLRRTSFISGGIYFEKLELTNFRAEPVPIRIQYSFGADFVDVFEVRGIPRKRRGERKLPEIGSEDVRLRYEGLDGIHRETRLGFSPTPTSLGARLAMYQLDLAPRRSQTIFLTIACNEGLARFEPAPFDEGLRAAEMRNRKLASDSCSIETDSEHLTAWLRRSSADLTMMMTDTPYGSYPYAGVPWFSAPFGRDGLLTALQAGWTYPPMMTGVLRFLAHYQAHAVDSERDAEPGKILHEMRYGEMANLREVPFGRYYGSIDATPLFLVLAGMHLDLVHDLAFMSELWPHVERAKHWIETFGDRDGDGFVEYGRQSTDGLLQQGWKDSHDSVWHADGSDAIGPIALCEVQGYVYAAWKAVSRIAGALGKNDIAEQTQNRANVLRRAFDQSFWCEDLGTYALALDGHKQPCRVLSSNAGHCLWTGIAYSNRAERMEQTLLSEAMFSGWGIRTIGSGEVRYNPMSYHNGSVWPHDTALVAEGLARYGFRRSAQRLFDALCDMSQVSDLNRLPELFCGFPREPGRLPIGYPVACAPQAWSSATVFSMLRGLLGLEIDAGSAGVKFEHPRLPTRVGRITLGQLRVGANVVHVHAARRGDDVRIEILNRSGETLLTANP